MELRLSIHNEKGREFLVSKGYLISYQTEKTLPVPPKDYFYPKTIKRGNPLEDSPTERKELSCVNYLATRLSPEERRKMAALLRKEGIEC